MHDATAGTAPRSRFGTLADGRAVDALRLVNANGLSATVLTLGATLQAMHAPDRGGQMGDVVLGFADPQAYLDAGGYLGASVGRFANRIADAAFTLNGVRVQLDANDGTNHLHGGAAGLHAKVWEVVGHDAASATLRCTSADGEGGYPGALTVEVRYALGDDDALAVTYTATTTRPTIVSLTNHAYWNLAGAGDVMDHRLTLHASAYLPVDARLIPTGEVRAVDETPFDFRAGQPIGERIREADAQLALGRGYDHCLVLDGVAGTLREAAVLEDAASGRRMVLRTDAAALQVYSGNVLTGGVGGKGGYLLRQGDGLCLEPQGFPDAPNQPAFPSARLDPGETFERRMTFAFSVF